MTSARIKPRSKSVWITPAACVAVAPTETFQARAGRPKSPYRQGSSPSLFSAVAVKPDGGIVKIFVRAEICGFFLTSFRVHGKFLRREAQGSGIPPSSRQHDS